LVSVRSLLLGPNVMLYVGDPLVEADWRAKAAQRKASFCREAEIVRGLAATTDLLKGTSRTLSVV
jgi:hypothetical protein